RGASAARGIGGLGVGTERRTVYVLLVAFDCRLRQLRPAAIGGAVRAVDRVLRAWPVIKADDRDLAVDSVAVGLLAPPARAVCRPKRADACSANAGADRREA